MTATAQPLPGQCHRQVVEVRAEVVAGVRRDVGAYVRLWGYGELADAAALCASELLSNVGKHTDSSTCVLTLERRSRGVRVTVSDGSGKLPVVGVPDATEEGGRGLLVVAGVADAWGAAPTGDGKDVWVELRATGARARACGERVALPGHLADAARYFAPGGPEDVERELRCTLEAHSTGDHHALVLELPEPASALWASWVRGHAPAAVLVLPDCPDVCPSAGVPCCEFATHPGAHTWQLEP
ncbi:ATP-binding protein [Streptomyces sp. NPDC021020]|uniref:ATP-binding protein n=1 Tax=Streptomyces sp. NPDC021020 TaxID=3365109 RepID=UPI00378C6B7B